MADKAKAAQLALVVTFFTHGVVATTYLPRIPEFIEQIDVGLTEWGLIIGLSAFGSVLPLLFTNRLVGRFGTRPIIQIGAVLLSVMMMSFAHTTSPIVFFLLNALFAFSMSLFNIALNAQSVMLQKQLKSVIIGKFHAAWSVGAAASAALSGLLAAFMPLWLHLFLVPAACIVIFLSASRYLLAPSEDGHEYERSGAKRIPFFKSPPMVWLLAAGFFAGVFPELVMMDWSAVFSQRELGLNATLGAIPYTVFTAAMIAGRLAINPLTKRYHLSQLSQLGGMFGAVAMLLGAVLGPLLAAQDRILGLVVTSVFWLIAGLGIAPMVPSFFSAAGHVPGMPTAQVLSRMSLVNTLVVMVAKIFMGALAEGYGLVFAYILPVFTFFVAGLLAATLVRQARRADALQNAFPPTGPITSLDSP